MFHGKIPADVVTSYRYVSDLLKISSEVVVSGKFLDKLKHNLELSVNVSLWTYSS